MLGDHGSVSRSSEWKMIASWKRELVVKLTSPGEELNLRYEGEVSGWPSGRMVD